MSYDPPVRALEDQASADGDPGVPLLFVRRAAPANSSGADGDYEFGQMSAGRLWVSATIDAALPAGANVIGGVTQSGTWNIGTVTTVTAVTSLTQMNGQAIAMGTGTRSAGTQRVTVATDDLVPVSLASVPTHEVTITAGAATIAKAEDVLSANGDVGVPAMATRKATPANVSGTDGDYEFLQMSAGRLWCSVAVDTALPAGANLLGSVGIDQTTPGTTNGVIVRQVVEAVGTITALDAVVAAPGGAGQALSGTPTAGSFVGFELTGGESSVCVQINGGSWTGTLYFEGSNNASAANNGNWISIQGQRLGINETTLASGYTSAGSGIASIFRLLCGGFRWVRVRLVGSVFTSNTSIYFVHSPGAGNTILGGSLPVGSNIIGALVANQSVNMAQINGVAPLMGAGNTGTGSHRVTVATDQAPVAVRGYNPAATYRGCVATFRIPGRAGTAGQKLFAIHNATGSTKVVRVHKLIVDKYETVVKAVTVAPPIIRAHRVTVLPTNGTAGSKVAKDTALASNASITTFQDASADGTGSGTTLTATIPANSCFAQEFASRLITAAGYEAADKITLLDVPETDGQVLRALEGIVVNLDYSLATQNPATDMWTVYCEWTEEN